MSRGFGPWDLDAGKGHEYPPTSDTTELIIPIQQPPCTQCREYVDSPVREQQHQINMFVSRLDEHRRRSHAALESKRLGHGGDKLLSQITGLDVETFRRGGRELVDELADRPGEHVRLSGGDQHPVEKKAGGGRGLEGAWTLMAGFIYMPA